MANYYVDPINGNASYDGTSPVYVSGTTGPKDTIAHAEALSLVAGDIVYLRSGVYREMITLAHSGGNLYTTGTVSVTAGSAIVTGLNTLWLANAHVGGRFQIPVVAHGTDGVTNGTATFTSATGNFQASMVGLTIRINTKAAYVISAVASATSITLINIDGSTPAPSAGTGLTYDVGPLPPYTIRSVDSNTQITLTIPWGEPTLTGESYQTWQDIQYLGDYNGAIWAGGGVVRLTNSSDDRTVGSNAQIILQSSTGRSYRTFTNIAFDTVTSVGKIFSTNSLTGVNWIIENCTFNQSSTAASYCIYANNAGNLNWTIRNCYFKLGSQVNAVYCGTTLNDNVAWSVLNCIVVGGNAILDCYRWGGAIVKNCFVFMSSYGAYVAGALTVGQALTVKNNIFDSCINGVRCVNANELLEDYNNYFGSTSADRYLALVGTHSLTYLVLQDLRWFFQLVNSGSGPNSVLQVVTPFDLSPWSQLINVAGMNPTLPDMRGTLTQGAQRDWGPLEYDPTLKIQAGGGGGAAVSISPDLDL